MKLRIPRRVGHTTAVIHGALALDVPVTIVTLSAMERDRVRSEIDNVQQEHGWAGNERIAVVGLNSLATNAYRGAGACAMLFDASAVQELADRYELLLEGLHERVIKAEGRLSQLLGKKP